VSRSEAKGKAGGRVERGNTWRYLRCFLFASENYDSDPPQTGEKGLKNREILKKVIMHGFVLLVFWLLSFQSWRPFFIFLGAVVTARNTCSFPLQ